MIVDSSTWIDYFKGEDLPHAARLDEALREQEDLLTIGLIVTEVLQGFRSDPEFERARAVLEIVPMIRPTLDGHVRAANLYRTLRRKGVTVGGATDCIIAQVCLDYGTELLSSDRGFERIAKNTALRLWR
jgi:hypothetical protein